MSTSRIGRPFTTGITESLVTAAERVMIEDGYSALTVDGLVAEVGTTRPTFYRRFSNVAHVALAVIASRFGTGAPVDTGSLRGDLLAVQREGIAMFSSPLLRNALPGLLEAVRLDAEVRAVYERAFVGPRRANIARIIAAAVARDEITEPEVDIDYVCDVLVGPLLSRALLPIDAPLDEQLARQTVQTAIATIHDVRALGD